MTSTQVIDTFSQINEPTSPIIRRKEQSESPTGEFQPKNGESFVRYIDHMGNDAAIVQAARVSYGAGTKTIRDDEKLIRYLMKHDHTTPLEMVELKFHIKAPVFVVRQWIRHRTANVNELSGRYSIINEDYYMPDVSRLKKQHTTNKQQSSDECITEAEYALRTIEDSLEQSFEAYNKLLKMGLARETARGVLPLNVYTEFYWKNDLHNTLKFLKLRLSPDAQEEIRGLAVQLAHIIKEIVPATWKAWCELEYTASKVTLEDWKDSDKYLALFQQSIDKKVFLQQNGLI